MLAIRLYLDMQPLAYFIHSIIVFLDMILIHIFTNTWWLSLLGELVTIGSFLAFHFTKETVWELLETTLLAILSSFYMIASRKQVMEERDGLEDDIDSLRRRGAMLLRNISQVHAAIREKEEEENSNSGGGGGGSDGKTTSMSSTTTRTTDSSAMFQIRNEQVNDQQLPTSLLQSANR